MDADRFVAELLQRDNEQERLDDWLREQMYKATGEDIETTYALLAAHADYRDVERARKAGATAADLTRCFG
jgi:hypothetical protein